MHSRKPTGREVCFGDEEIIVTKTDLKGRITYVNDVFVRVSGFSEEQALGKPHNLIRHPDMPRCAFAALWDALEQGSEIFAYVKNLARTGDHYWVFAHVTPTFGPKGEIISYHSNRRTPNRAALAPIESLYATLLAEERRHARGPAQIAAAGLLLNEALAARKQTYGQFVFSLEDSARAA